MASVIEARAIERVTVGSSVFRSADFDKRVAFLRRPRKWEWNLMKNEGHRLGASGKLPKKICLQGLIAFEAVVPRAIVVGFVFWIGVSKISLLGAGGNGAGRVWPV